MGTPIQTYHISITNSKQKHKRQKVNFLCRRAGNPLFAPVPQKDDKKTRRED